MIGRTTKLLRFPDGQNPAPGIKKLALYQPCAMTRKNYTHEHTINQEIMCALSTPAPIIRCEIWEVLDRKNNKIVAYSMRYRMRVYQI